MPNFPFRFNVRIEKTELRQSGIDNKFLVFYDWEPNKFMLKIVISPRLLHYHAGA